MSTGANGGKRALVVANEAVAGSELRDSLIAHLGKEIDEVFVVAPALTESGLKYMLGDVDAAIGPARERLERTLEELRGAGIEANGEVGDSDPMMAISDEIHKFNPDQVLVVAHRDEDGAFAERGLLEQIERDLDMPVIELVVDKARDPHVLDVEETEAVAGRRKGWRPSYNWPPLSPGQVGGILVAIVGTLLLGFLAADSPSAGRILIALAMALINLAHVVGLVLFQSVAYEGVWSRFFARLSLIGTPIAVGVSLLLGLLM
ncbi:MAG TPA: hypothetical protein VNO20_10245 [Solirubrobacterales bacterium]|nr:hypothetical protein [Solirubrobacterales bacterium]